MEEQLSTKELLSKTTDYLESKIELIKLKAINKGLDAGASVASRLFVISIMGSFVLMLNFGIAFLIGETLGKYYYGFFIVAGFYMITAILLYIFRHKIIKVPLKNFFVKKMFN